VYFDRRLFGMTRGVRGRIVLAVLIGVIAVPLAIWRLTLTGNTIARVFEGRSLGSLASVLVLIAALILVRAVLQFAREEVANGTASIVKVELRRRLFEHVLALGPVHLDGQRTGDVLLSLVEGVEQLDTFFGQYLPQLIVAALTPLIIFLFMVFLDVRTAFVFLIAALFTLIAPAAFHRWNAHSALARREAYAAMGADLLDSIQGLPTLKAFGQSRQRGEMLAVRARRLFQSTMYVLAVNIGTSGITMLGISAGAAAALAWGAVRVHNGDLRLGTLLVVLLLGVEVFRPLRDLTVLYHKGMVAMAATRGIYDLLDAAPDVREPEAPVPFASHTVSTVNTVLTAAGSAATVASASSLQIEPSLRFEAVTFGYSGGRRPALRALDFALHAGETLGVVGPSGAGKSTIVNLLLRFADPQQGRVLLGGHDLRTLPLARIRASVALVAQDTYLFHGTVAENLRLGKPDAGQAELESAARVANAHDFIAALPQGYDTIVGERGARLSGGQRARIAIARALLKDAPILVLDEALSSVDAENEATIQQALERLRHGRTTLVIAHRLSSVINAGRIIVLDRGAIVETGTHATLIGAGGLYARLMAAQYRAGDALVDPAMAGGAVASTSETSSFAEMGTLNEAGRSLAAGGAAERLETDVDRTLPIVPASLPAAQVWLRLLRLVGPWWWEAVLTFAGGLLHAASVVGLGVAGALLVRRVVLGGSLTASLVALLALVPITAALTWFESWIAHDLAFRLLAEMRIALYRLLDPLAPAYLQRHRTGDIISTATGDVETIELFFAHTIAPLFVALLVPGGVLLALALVAWPLALVLAPFLAGVALTPLIAGRAMERLGAALRSGTGDANAQMVDGVQGLRTIVAFGRGRARTDEIAANSHAFYRLQRRFLRDQAVQNGVIESLTGLGALAVLATGAWLVTRGQLPRTTLPVVTLLAATAFGPVTEIVRTLKELAQTLASARRYFAIEDEPVPVRDGPGISAGVPAPMGATAVTGHAAGLPLAFDGVSFCYDAGATPALRDVHFQVSAGQTVALVGRSGAGKTTLAHLLLRFWDPSSGRILLAGHDLREYRLDELRRLVALVAQDTYLFDGTLWENLRLGREDATDEEVRTAARRANVEEFAVALPDGYATQIGERGMQLSGGQRQRLAIARALLKDAPVLVLDEATSHLDAVNEAEVRQALERLMAGRTTLVIAHRLSTVRDAGSILVLDAGRVVEQGPHAALLEQNGLYARLIATQVTGSGRTEPAIAAATAKAGAGD